MDEQIKQAFLKVKEDMRFLRQELLLLRNEINNLKNTGNTLNFQENALKNTSTDRQTDRQISSTNPATSTHSSTVPLEIGGLKPSNLAISTGNEGASTDRQTDRQTDTSTHILPKKSIESNIQEASEILESLDNLKKEIRLKFKRITTQEMTVFSSIYQQEEQDPQQTTYKTLANTLKLSESSIRDYVQRMINKGIPLKKHKINNKKIILSISPNLKKIATLQTIIQLRDL